MKDYNGFPAAQRYRALAWTRKGYASGERKRATRCDACGQTEGVLDRHSEDYSEPFGEHIGRFSFCYTCHMMIHCRFKARRAWHAYRAAIARGARFPAVLTRNFRAVSGTFLAGAPPEPTWHPAPTWLVLDEIESGVLLPKDHHGNPRTPAQAD